METTPSFPQRIMEFHHGLDLDPVGVKSQNRMRAILHRAAELKLNTVYFGENWPNGMHRLVSYQAKPELAALLDQDAIKQRRAVYNELVERASELGLSLHAVIHPVTYPPGFLNLYPDAAAAEPPGWERQYTRGKPITPPLCPHHPATRELLRVQVEEILSLPGINGLSCWLNKSNSLIFACDCVRCHQQPLDQTIAEIGNFLQEICVEKGKQLNIRTYLGSWQCGLETVCFQSVNTQLNPKVRISYKQQQGDMYNEHPLNPLLGTLNDRPQAIEFDCYGEYRGNLLGLVTSCRHQMQAGLQAAKARGLDAVIMRGLHNENRFAVDQTCFSALALDVNCDVEEVALAHLCKRVGSVAAPEILALLDDGWQFCRRSMYVRGVNWASWSVPQNLERLRFILFDRSAPCVTGAFDRLKMDDVLIQEHAQLQNEAVEIAEKMQARVNALEHVLDPEDFASLQASTQAAAAYALLCRCLMPTVLRSFQLQVCPSTTMREFLRLDILEKLSCTEKGLEETAVRLSTINVEALQELIGPIEMLNQPPKELLLQPVVNARVICNDIRSLIGFAPSSFTGIIPAPHRWPTGIEMSDFGCP